MTVEKATYLLFIGSTIALYIVCIHVFLSEQAKCILGWVTVTQAIAKLKRIPLYCLNKLSKLIRYSFYTQPFQATFFST